MTILILLVTGVIVFIGISIIVGMVLMFVHAIKTGNRIKNTLKNIETVAAHAAQKHE